MINNFNNNKVIYCENLTKIYKNKTQTVRAVDGISFTLKRGEIVGFLGPNGAGKTTTIKCLCRLINPSSGMVLIDGVDVIKRPNFAFEKIAAVLEGNRNVYWRMSVRENLEFFAGLMGYGRKEVKAQIEELVETFGLKEKVDTEARFLSRGMQQKLAISCALIKNTEILLLDEPTLGLDVETTNEVKELLRTKIAKEGKTILLSSHNMKLVEDTCERVIIINKGKIIADESVSRLKKFFAINTYRFEVINSIDEKIKMELSQKFFGTRFIANETKTCIDIDIDEPMQIYEVLEILKKNNIKLLGIQNIEPDFEEIYLRLVKDEK
ncbi:MAG: ABC transporter ATP-binding protein [candidate division WOR-3 bacterium]